MASFCGNCGSPLGDTSAFCAQCGASAGNRTNASATPAPPAQAFSPAKGNSALKIVVVILCCLAVGGAALVGGMIYLAHRVKQAVVAKAAENGVDLNSLNSSSAHTAAKHTLPRPCELLGKEEVSRLIGEPIERVEVKDAMCMYYGPQGLSAKLAEDQASSAVRRSQTPGAKEDATDIANSVDQLANSLGAQAGQIEGTTELPLLMIGLDADGRAQMVAVSASKAIFGSIGQAADAKSIGFGTDIPGLGDKAVRIPKLGLNVLLGDTLIRIIPGPFPDADAKAIAVARAALPRM